MRIVKGFLVGLLLVAVIYAVFFYSMKRFEAWAAQGMDLTRSQLWLLGFARFWNDYGFFSSGVIMACCLLVAVLIRRPKPN